MQTILSTVVHYSRLVYQTLGNRRKDERFPISGLLNASWKNQYGQIVTHSCQGVNLSAKGVALESEEPAVVCADAYLYSSAMRVKSFGVVRYCRRLGAGYQIGFRFQKEPQRWDGF